MINSQLIQAEIAEINNKILVCQNVLDRLRWRKEKLVLLLHSYEDLGDSVNLPDFSLSTDARWNVDESPKMNPQRQDLSQQPSGISSAGRTSLSGNPTRQPLGNPSISSAQNGHLKAFELDRLTNIAEKIIDYIQKKQLWSFSVTFLANTLQEDSLAIEASLELEAYSKFWRQHKNKNNPQLKETWVVDLDAVNRLNRGMQGTADLKPDVSSRTIRARGNFKKVFPANSTDNLVEQATSVKDLINRVFAANPDRVFNSRDIIDYLYPDQRKTWENNNRARIVQTISKELCASMKKGNWRRVELGKYKIRL